VDAEGNAVAVTYTLNSAYGSGVTVPGLGFLLNNNMDNFASAPGKPNQYGLVQGEANAIASGKRPLSSMAPTILAKDGKLYLVVGTPGGPTITTAVLQAILNVVDFGMNAQEAIDFPRFHHQWLPDKLTIEKGFSPDTIALLKAKGHDVEIVASRNDMMAIRLHNGWIEGAADPRREGKAAGY
jgi:gamma-glutamyltranspeptidase/glutathione hydrolase